jgi:hypothetical protein
MAAKSSCSCSLSSPHQSSKTAIWQTFQSQHSLHDGLEAWPSPSSPSPLRGRCGGRAADVQDQEAVRAPARRRVGRWCWAPAWTGQRGVARAATKRPTTARTKARGGLPLGELLTLLLTPGVHRTQKPSYHRVFLVIDRKSSKLTCHNEIGQALV